MKLVGLGTTVAAEGQAQRHRSTMTCRCSRSVPPTVLLCPFYGVPPMGRKPILTPHQKKEARQRIAKGEMTRDLAKSYGVSVSTISRLAT